MDKERIKSLDWFPKMALGITISIHARKEEKESGLWTVTTSSTVFV